MVLFWLVFWLVLSFVIYLLLLSFFKGTLWLKLNGKKISWKKFFKYLIMNLIYIIPFTLISFWMYFNGMFSSLFFLIFLFFYFYTISCYYLSIKEKVWNTIKSTFVRGLNLKIIFRYVLFSVLFFFLNYVFSNFTFSYKIIFNLFFYVIFLSVFKIYMNNIFKVELK